MNYIAAERESVIICDDESKKWRVYTLQSTLITKLSKIGEKPIRIDNDGGHWYELDYHQVSFRKREKRKMSVEQRQQAAERLRKVREGQ